MSTDGPQSFACPECGEVALMEDLADRLDRWRARNNGEPAPLDSRLRTAVEAALEEYDVAAETGWATDLSAAAGKDLATTLRAVLSAPPQAPEAEAFEPQPVIDQVRSRDAAGATLDDPFDTPLAKWAFGFMDTLKATIEQAHAPLTAALSEAVAARIPDTPTAPACSSTGPNGVTTVNPEHVAELAALTEGWDGYGAAPISLEALLVLRRLIAVPTVLGGIQIEWHANGREVEIEIGPDGEIESFLAMAVPVGTEPEAQS